MKGVGIIILLALASTGLLKAGGFIGTNNMPEPFHALMETEGYALVQTNLDLPAPGTNSLRNLPVIEQKRFVLIKPSTGKAGWTFWDNASVKYVGKNTDPINIFQPSTLTPFAALSKFEYNINYSFNF